jgi:hypothetical protein
MTFQKFKTFIKSLFFHIYAGFPKSTKQEITDRYEICLVCDKYSHQYKQCLMCGCNINNKKIFMNKLAWADQECPLGKWSKINRK